MKRQNRLADATSDYLRQHAGDPVGWEEWGDAAVGRARQEDKPIFLSIGFATCHWCHVMARESFSNPEIAAVLNEHFVAIKVDREERPDIDRIYLEALRRLTGRGGWPATILLTPALEPFFGGTYFPREPQGGLPGLKRLLVAINTAWHEQRERLIQNGRDVAQDLFVDQIVEPSGSREETTEAALEALEEILDREHGGVGQGPKFPAPPLLAYLLVAGQRGDREAARHLRLTLGKMARGGIYDQVGGGFHRYAVDRQWQIPHFEKSLVDNAQLARCYLQSWQVTGEGLYEVVARETIDYILDELQQEGGGLASGQDAEVDGREGGAYVWEYQEVIELVGSDVASALGATPEGNWEGVNVLRGAEPGVLQARSAWRGHLRQRRVQREQPARNEAVVAAWNGMAAIALAEAGRALGEERYLSAGVAAATFVLDHLGGREGERLMRSWNHGKTGVAGFLDDYAFMGLGCLALHQATLQPHWLDVAIRLAGDIRDLFAGRGEARLFLTGTDVAPDLVRPIDSGELASPSATAAAVDLLIRTSRVLDDRETRDFAWEAIGPQLSLAGTRPEEHMHALMLLRLASAPAPNIALIGEPDSIPARELAAVLWSGYFPGAVLAAAPEGSSDVSLLVGRGMVDQHPAAYVCEGTRCLRPVTRPEELAGQLSAEDGLDPSNLDTSGRLISRAHKGKS